MEGVHSPTKWLGDKNFDQLNVGQVCYSVCRTISEGEVVAFAGLAWDWHPLHTNDIAARKSQFKGRIAHGTLLIPIVGGLMIQTGLASDYSMGFLGLKDWTFDSPVYLGDTVQVRFEIKEKRASRTKPDRGIITILVQVLNVGRGNQICCQGHWLQMHSRVPLPSA